jgi:hypothetical protein
MFSVSSNPFHFSVDLILWNKKKPDEDKSGEYGGDLILVSFVSTKAASLILQ